MKAVLVTTADNQFGGVFATAYHQAGGPPWQAIIVLPDRSDIGFPLWTRGYVALKLFGFVGTLELLRIRVLPQTLSSTQKSRGLGSQWLSTITFPKTKVYSRNSINSQETIKLLESLAPDILVSVGAPVIIKEKVLNIPAIGAINVHNGRIPKYRGHFGTFWEVFNKEKWAYTCVHEMVPKVDKGRVLAFEKIEVSQIKSFLNLLIQKKVFGGQLLAELLNKIDRLGRMPDTSFMLDMNDVSEDYFGFPTLTDIQNFSWKNKFNGNTQTC